MGVIIAIEVINLQLDPLRRQLLLVSLPCLVEQATIQHLAGVVAEVRVELQHLPQDLHQRVVRLGQLLLEFYFRQQRFAVLSKLLSFAVCYKTFVVGRLLPYYFQNDLQLVLWRDLTFVFKVSGGQRVGRVAREEDAVLVSAFGFVIFLLRYHLAENTSCAPYIDRRSVVGLQKDNFRGSVPTRGDVLGETPRAAGSLVP